MALAGPAANDDVCKTGRSADKEAATAGSGLTYFKCKFNYENPRHCCEEEAHEAAPILYPRVYKEFNFKIFRSESLM